MPRRGPDLCILCEKYPCECGKTVKPKRFSPPKSKEVPADAKPPSVSRPWSQAASVGDDSGPLVAAHGHDHVERVPTHTERPSVAHAPIRAVDVLLEEEAIRALEPLLSDADKEKFRVILTGKLSQDEAAAVWKARREWVS